MRDTAYLDRLRLRTEELRREEARFRRIATVPAEAYAKQLQERARNQGREVIVADGDWRNADLAALYPRQAMQPPSDDMSDVKEWISSVLVRMAETGQSVALDLGDRVLAEYGRDLTLVDFCQVSSVLQFSPKVGFENSLIGVPFRIILPGLAAAE